MWTCPSCGRSFRNNNQYHSCAVFSVEKHLWNRPAGVVALYYLLEEMVRDLGGVTVDAMKSTILFRGETAFLSVAVRKKRLDVSLMLTKRITASNLIDVVEISPGRFVHKLRITHPDDLDETFRAWVWEAARLSGVGTNDD